MDRDVFFRTMLRELAGSLEDLVGLREAAGYMALVGEAVGQQMDARFRAEREQDSFDRAEVVELLVELKRRIGGTFRVDEVTDDAITLVNDDCPFGDMVHGRPSLCMMTSNVFGHLTATHLGYAGVTLQKTIAKGDGHCRVRVALHPTGDGDGLTTREYFGPVSPRAT